MYEYYTSVYTEVCHVDVVCQFAVEYERGQISLKMVSTDEVNEVVAHIGSCLQRICPGLPPL